MALVGYARVSTTGQSLEAQLEALKHCDKVFQEKVSGAKDDRPQLHQMLDYVREGDTVQVTKLDRLARNTRHLLEIADRLSHKGVSLQVLNLGIDTASPTGKLMMTLIGGIATFERELMLERQAEGIALAKRKGKYKGRKPTAMTKARDAEPLLAAGIPKAEVARRLAISLSSVQRIARKLESKETP